MNNLTDIDNICLISECNNKIFHYVRVALATFIEKNDWFDGTIVILTLESNPLSAHNTNMLNLIYDDIQIAVIPDSEISELKAKVERRKYYEDIYDYLKIYAFKIKSRGNIYMSNKVIVLSQLSDIITDDAVSLSSTSESFPNPGTGLTATLMYVPECNISDEIFDDLYGDLIANVLNGTDKYLTDHVSTRFNVNKLSGNVLVESSAFPNNRYSNFVRYSKAISAIHIPISILSDAKYSRVQIYLNQHMTRLNKMKTPSKIRTSRIKAPVLPKGAKRIDLVAEFGKDNIRNTKLSDRVAVFTTLNNAYIKYAITCFESYRANSKEDNLDFYIFCKDATQESLDTLHKHNIKLIEMDLSEKYKIPTGYPYPSECFWIFDCPAVLYNLGYSHSIGVDSDTYCNLPLNMTWLQDVTGIAGVDRGATVKKFLVNIKQLPQLKKLFKITNKGLNAQSINTGVLVFNNKYCHETKFSDKVHRVFSHSMKNGVPRKGDDSLFSLVLSIFDEIPLMYLDKRYNDYHFYRQRSIPSVEPIIIHYGKGKPWAEKLLTGPVTTYYLNKWINFKKTIK